MSVGRERDQRPRRRQILAKYQALQLELAQVPPPALIASYQDMREQLATLVYHGFITAARRRTGCRTCRGSSTAIEIRLRKLLNAGLQRDPRRWRRSRRWCRQYLDRREKHRHRRRSIDPELETVPLDAGGAARLAVRAGAEDVDPDLGRATGGAVGESEKVRPSLIGVARVTQPGGFHSHAQVSVMRSNPRRSRIGRLVGIASTRR